MKNNKEIRFYIMKSIKKMTGCDLKNASKMARLFLNDECFLFSPELSNLGFFYNWEWNGEREEKIFKGFEKENGYIEVPLEFFQLKEQYQQQKRIPV